MDEPESEAVPRGGRRPATPFGGAMAFFHVHDACEVTPPAVKDEKFGGTWRPVRQCEHEGLQQRRSFLEREARDVLAKCRDFEGELRRSEELRGSQELKAHQQELREGRRSPRAETSPFNRFASQAFAAPAGVFAEEDDAKLLELLMAAAEARPRSPKRGKVRMCPTFLDEGFCTSGQDCEFAHHPSELKEQPLAWSLGGYQENHFAADVEELGLRAEQGRRQQQGLKGVACAVVHDRASAVDDDAVLRSLLGPSVAAPAPAAPTLSQARSQMCAEYLDAGSCSMGRDCPFAHHPSQLGR